MTATLSAFLHSITSICHDKTAVRNRFSQTDCCAPGSCRLEEESAHKHNISHDKNEPYRRVRSVVLSRQFMQTGRLCILCRFLDRCVDIPEFQAHDHQTNQTKENSWGRMSTRASVQTTSLVLLFIPALETRCWNVKQIPFWVSKLGMCAKR